MTEANTQTAASEAPASAAPDATANSAQNENDLTALLNEFDEANKPPTPQPEQKAQAEPNPLADEVRNLQAAIFTRDVTDTVKAIRGEMDAQFFDDDLVKGWLNAQADANPQLKSIFEQRYANKDRFDKTVKALNREFAKRYGKLPDKSATEDREAVTAAVRAASTEAPKEKAPNYGAMNDADFKKELAKYL